MKPKIEEDTSGFYKFVPNVNGNLKQGGELFMLKAKRDPNIDLGVRWEVGTTWDVEWVRIDDPLAAGRSTFQQGRLKGGARFQRLEGAWWGGTTGYFVSTNGGQVQAGQVFEYDPRRETLRLMYDSPAAEECDYPDNMTVTPRGGLLLCEDSGNKVSPSERLIGSDARRPDVHVRVEQRDVVLRLQLQRLVPVTIARANLPAAVTARTDNGCS